MKKQTMKDKEEARRAENKARDLRYISDPMQWVQFVCPVKRYVDGKMQTAYLTGDGPNLYLGNMFSASPTDQKVPYADYAAIVDAGWMVD